MKTINLSGNVAGQRAVTHSFCYSLRGTPGYAESWLALAGEKPELILGLA
jgi:hypothetical protein